MGVRQPSEYANIRRRMESLIQQKIGKYPKIMKQIVSCELKVVDGKDHITVASVALIR